MTDSLIFSEKLLQCGDIFSCISILESHIKEETSLDNVKICIFDMNSTMKCFANGTHYAEKLNRIDHFTFNCIIYKFSELKSGIVDDAYVKKHDLKCSLVSNHNMKLAFSDIVAHKKIGIIVGYNENGKEISEKQLSILQEYAKKYANVLNNLRRLEERKDKIEYLSFLADINKNVPKNAHLPTIMKKFLSMILTTMDFDVCVHIQHKKGEVPLKIKDAVKTIFSTEEEVLELLPKLKLSTYPIIDHINQIRLKGEVFGSSFTFINSKNHEIAKYFDEFVIIPLNELSSDEVNYIICLNRIGKKSLTKTTTTQLTIFQNQIIATLKNTDLIRDIKEDYDEIKELYNLTHKLNQISIEKKVIEKALDEVMSFFKADIGIVYHLKNGTRVLFEKNVIVEKNNNLDIKSIFSKNNSAIYSSTEKEFISFKNATKQNSQIVMFIPVNKSLEYVFILQSHIDYKLKQKYKTLCALIAKTIESIVENARMHEEIIKYNKILLADKKMLSDAIAEDREKLFSIVNGMDEPLIAINSEGKIEIFNDASENMFGIDKEDIVRTDAKLFCKQWKIPLRFENRTFTHKILEFALNDKFYKIIKTAYNTKQGKQGSVLVLENVTKEREVEEMKNEFISILSHEMKTPLTSITGFSKLLLTHKLGEITNQQKDCIDVIYDEGERLKNLVEEILDIERLEKGKLTLNRTPINIITIYNDVIDNKIMIKNKDIKILKEFPEKVPLVMADEDKLRQVLINLVSNAIKFTDDGGNITVRLKYNDKEMITDVADTGIGMKQEELDHIFDKFYQVSNHLTRNKGGLGLGLSIVKKILDLHNGHIEVRSKLGKGSVFTFYLPIEE